MDQYVIVDDNFFPYQPLGQRSDPLERNCGRAFEGKLKPHPSKEDIFAAVVPLPEKAYMEPETARYFGSKYFTKPAVAAEIARLRKDLSIDAGDPLITRLFLTSSNSFKRRKRLASQGRLSAPADSLSRFPLTLDLPHFIWVMELSPLSLYNRGIILGEIVLDASADKSQGGSIYARIGDMLEFAGKRAVHSNCEKAFRQYTHNLGERHDQH